MLTCPISGERKKDGVTQRDAGPVEDQRLGEGGIFGRKLNSAIARDKSRFGKPEKTCCGDVAA